MSFFLFFNNFAENSINQMIDFTNVGAVVKKYRLLRDRLQKDMAQVLCIKEQQYANLEKGKSLMSVEQLAKLANELNIPTFELVTSGVTDDKIVNALEKMMKEIQVKLSGHEGQ